LRAPWYLYRPSPCRIGLLSCSSLVYLEIHIAYDQSIASHDCSRRLTHLRIRCARFDWALGCFIGLESLLLDLILWRKFDLWGGSGGGAVRLCYVSNHRLSYLSSRFLLHIFCFSFLLKFVLCSSSVGTFLSRRLLVVFQTMVKGPRWENGSKGDCG
jgi:hypothetical protein